MTTYQSCNEIPSQTYVDSGQLEDFNELNSAKMLWSDEVEGRYDHVGTTKETTYNGKKDNNQLQKTSNSEVPTVNPSSPKTRLTVTRVL